MAQLEKGRPLSGAASSEDGFCPNHHPIEGQRHSKPYLNDDLTGSGSGRYVLWPSGAVVVVRMRHCYASSARNKVPTSFGARFATKRVSRLGIKRHEVINPFRWAFNRLTAAHHLIARATNLRARWSFTGLLRKGALNFQEFRELRIEVATAEYQE